MARHQAGEMARGRIAGRHAVNGYNYEMPPSASQRLAQMTIPSSIRREYYIDAALKFGSRAE